MFTDIVGYTKMGQDNEALALETLQEHRQTLRPLFAKHGGREVKTMGDAFLVEFGSALEAVLCAIDIQSTLHSLNLERGERLQVRLGIHLGDVVHASGDVLGDAVNVASRIEPLAREGGICVSQQVMDHVRNKVAYPMVKLETRQLKNVTVPTEVYRVELPWEGEQPPPPAESAGERSRLAVLPLANFSPDKADDYLADGMTEELITSLSSIEGLRVIARTSAMRYKNSPKAVSEIGRELRVGTLLEGSIRKSGNKLRVTTQLVDANTEEHLWASNYDRNMDDVFEIQTDIAGKVADALKLRLGAAAETRRQTENLDAYTLCLQAHVLWSMRTKEANEQAIAKFESALSRDPRFARALAGLANCYYIAASNGFVERKIGMPMSKDYLSQALGIDDSLSEAHTLLAMMLKDEKKYKEAEEEFRKAISLNPSYATSHQWYANLLGLLGRPDEALKEAQKAADMDPVSPIILFVLTYWQSLTGHMDDALGTSRRNAEINPGSSLAISAVAIVSAIMGKSGDAFKAAEEFGRLEKNDVRHKDILASVHAILGNKEETRRLLQEIIPFVKESSFVDSTEISFLYGLMGEREEFFKWAEIGVRGDNGSNVIDSVRYFPAVFNGFRELQLEKDSRCAGLLRQMNLPS